jgi:hypothetical protein
VNDAAQASEFDQRTRERIRRQLLAYAERHGIGAPTLRDRIEKSDDRGRELPLSTLQRFLGAKHRTLDLYVGMIAAFLARENAPYDGDEFGSALAAFIGERAARPVDVDAEASWLSEFAGSYTNWIYGHGEIGGGDLYFPPRGKARGKLKLDPVDAKPYLAIDRKDRIRGETVPADAFDPYEGVALASGGALYLFMRSCLTRIPESGFLTPRQRDGNLRTLEGTLYRFEPAGIMEPLAPLTITVRLQCLPDAQGDAAHG